MIREERMSPAFNKLHLDIGKFPLTIHHFTGPDVGDPHDHPLPFTTTILAGGYIEEVWTQGQHGIWSAEVVARLPGTSHRVEATDIHRIVELPEGECLTTVRWHEEGVEKRQPRFWRMTGEVRSRQWDEPEFAS